MFVEAVALDGVLDRLVVNGVRRTKRPWKEGQSVTSATRVSARGDASAVKRSRPLDRWRCAGWSDGDRSGDAERSCGWSAEETPEHGGRVKTGVGEPVDDPSS